MSVSLDDRVLARKLAVEKLSSLARHEGLGVAMGIAVDLAKKAGMDADKFATIAYVAFAHCDGTKEEAIKAIREALAAVRAARARAGK